MVLVLDYVPTPSFSDGTRDFYPEVFKTHRQPAGGYAECDPARVQRYLEKLSTPLKEAYSQNPHKIPGVDPEEVRQRGGVSFLPLARLKSFPGNYKMYESRKENGAWQGGEGVPGGMNEVGSAVSGEKSESVKSESGAAGDDDGKLKPLRTERYRCDAFIFGHPSGSKFRSTNEFTPHLIWLVTDDTHNHANCPCKLCVNYIKSGGKCFPKGRGTLGRNSPFVTPTSTPSISRPQATKQEAEPSPLLTTASASRAESPSAPASAEHTPAPSTKKKPPQARLLPSDDIMPGDMEVESIQTSPRASPIPISHDVSDMDEPNAPLEEKKLKQKKPSTKDAYNDVRYKKKYKELKRKIHDMEEENIRLEKEYQQAKKRVGRLRFERSLLQERLASIHSGAMPKERFNDDSSSSSESSPAPIIPRPPTVKKPRAPRPKKPLDPNAPRRPANAFMLFCDMSREQLKAEREGLEEAEREEKGLTNLTKALGYKWRALSDKERGEWRDRFLKEVERYDREMIEYQNMSELLAAQEGGDAGSSVIGASSPAVSAAITPAYGHDTQLDVEDLDEDISVVESPDAEGRDRMEVVEAGRLSM